MKTKNILLLVVSIAIIISINSCKNRSNNTNQELTKINLRLQWFAHSQFAGYIIADVKGFGSILKKDRYFTYIPH